MVMDEDVRKTNDVERTQRTEVVYPTKTSASDVAITSQVPPPLLIFGAPIKETVIEILSFEGNLFYYCMCTKETGPNNNPDNAINECFDY